VLQRPQPAILALIASGYTPIYPCHVLARDMRQHPIGTGPFKFAEFKPNEGIKLVRNPDYWKPGRPYLDGIEYTIIPNRSTAILAFIAGKFPARPARRLCRRALAAVKAVAAVAHHLTGLANIAELLGQLQQTELGSDDLLLLGHA
jgi:peptide/nickel transport system substrate-binding protein